MLENYSVHAFIQKYGIKTEQGNPLSFKDHLFLFEPYSDMSPKQVIFKAAQIGFSTLAINKTFWIARHKEMSIIYTLPTEGDVRDFAGGKVNRIVDQNPIYKKWVKDKDTVEQKRIGNSMIYYRGTWSKKAAIMVSSDLNVYDEVDSSKQPVVEEYSTRLQHSKYKWEWYFSHPSSTGIGVDKYWNRSDQKHWFIKCSRCKTQQYLEWPGNIDQDREVFICSHCKKELSYEDRRVGEWVQKWKGKEFSGYWISLLMAPWVSAKEIIKYHKFKDEEYFVNKVLGLPYVGGGNKLAKALFEQNLTDESLYPERNERVVIGVDTGKELHYVIGGLKGLFYYGTAKDYDEIESLLKRWPRAIAVIDQGGDLIGSRKLREKEPGRVFLCTYGTDRKTRQLVRWGKHDERGAVIADRNRCIQLTVDEFTDQRIPVMGKAEDWYDYWLHWNNMTRIKELDEKTNTVKRRIWVRSGDDHWAHATTYWRIGMSRFGAEGSLIKPGEIKDPNTPTIITSKKDWRIK